MSRIFFDTEFTGLHKGTTLISIGLIAENGTTFYAEVTDYDKSQVDPWIQENVINKLLWNDRKSFIDIEQVPFNNSIKMKDNSCEIGRTLRMWLDQFDTIEWVSDVAHYDFVLLIDLVYGKALGMPYGKHCAACHDINQDIAKYFKISEIEAFDFSREEIISKFCISIDGEKHNALYDAKVIKAIYNSIN